MYGREQFDNPLAPGLARPGSSTKRALRNYDQQLATTVGTEDTEDKT